MKKYYVVITDESTKIKIKQKGYEIFGLADVDSIKYLWVE